MISSPDDRIHVFVEYIRNCKVDSRTQFQCRGDDRLPQVGDLVGVSSGEEGHKDVYKVTEIIWTDNWKTMHVKASYELRSVVLDSHVPGSGEPSTKPKRRQQESLIRMHLRYIVNGRHVSTQGCSVPRIEIPNRGDHYTLTDGPLCGCTEFEVVRVKWIEDEHTECVVELVNVKGK